MDEGDNEVCLENPSSSDLDSHLNNLIKNISDDDCDSIICSQQVVINEEKEVTVLCTLSPENEHNLRPFDYVTEDKYVHDLHCNSDDSENRKFEAGGMNIDEKPVFEEFNSRKSNTFLQNAVESANRIISSNHEKSVLQNADKITKVTGTQEFSNIFKRKYSEPCIGEVLDKGFYPSSSWPSDSTKLRKRKCKSYFKLDKMKGAHNFKSKLLKSEEYRTQSQEIFLEEVESLHCFSRKQETDIVSESLNSEMNWNVMTHATESVHDAYQSQESLFDDFEAVQCVPDELVTMENCTPTRTLAITVASTLDLSSETSSQAPVFSLCFKEKASEQTLQSFKLNMPLVSEQAVSPVSKLLPPELADQTETNHEFSISQLKTQDFIKIPVNAPGLSYKTHFQTEKARQAALPSIEKITQLELPLIEEARQPELALMKESRQPELALMKESRQPELALIEEARQPELLLIEEARQPELSLIEEARQPELPLMEEARQPELPLIEEARQPELPLIEESRQPELPPIEEARQPDLPLIEEARQPELPLIEEARQPELPLIEEARQPKLPLIEEARQPKLSSMEKVTQPELLLIEPRQSELPLIKQLVQTELPLIDEIRETELPLIDEVRQTELPQKEEARHEKLFLSPTAEGLSSLCSTLNERQDKVLLVSENKQLLSLLPYESSSKQHHKLIVIQMKEQTFHSNFSESSCREFQSKSNKSMPDALHALQLSSHSVSCQCSETVDKSVYFRQDETFYDATQMIKHKLDSSHPDGSSVRATSPEHIISTYDRGAPKSYQHQYKKLAPDNIRRFDCEYQEMPRSPPVLLNMDGIPYLLPSSDHIVPQCEQTEPVERTPATDSVDSNTEVTDGSNTWCEDSEQTVLSYVQELHSTANSTESVHNSEAVSCPKMMSSCTSHQQDSTQICVSFSPNLYESKDTATGSSAGDGNLLLCSFGNQSHCHHSKESPIFEDTVTCGEQKVPEAVPCPDLSLSEMSMYSNLPEDKLGESKCKKQIKVFQWNTVYETAMNKSLAHQSSDSVLDGLSAIVPIVQSQRPLRVGLSRKQKVKHLHNKL